ncbi:hypothetical protein AcV5_002387 [Taiwanofungus camphoratus]|nr:hypothetical protein AcV5_002387 [Antrodia cinnamomea]
MWLASYRSSEYAGHNLQGRPPSPYYTETPDTKELKPCMEISGGTSEAVTGAAGPDAHSN